MYIILAVERCFDNVLKITNFNMNYKFRVYHST